MGRRRTCNCGVCPKCQDRIRKKRQYDAMTPAERRRWKQRKDPIKRYISDRRHHARQERRTPEKAKARDELQRALRGGRIKRLPCFVCGVSHGERRSDGSLVKVEAHHEDYTRPLDVKWVCTVHHRPPWVKDRG